MAFDDRDLSRIFVPKMQDVEDKEKDM